MDETTGQSVAPEANAATGTGEASAAIASAPTTLTGTAAAPVIQPDSRTPEHRALASADHSPEWDGEFEEKPYRIAFKNGIEIECDGAMLKTNFPFPPEQVADIRLVSDVGRA
jgi:hypothetical protein